MALFTDPSTTITDPEDLIDDGNTYSLNDFVGEGKKYKTPEDVAKALVYKDAFIEQLKGENQLARTALDRAKEELKTRQTLEEFLDRMNTQRPPSPSPANNQNAEEDGALNQEKIKQLVEQTLTQRTTQEREQANLDHVKQKLIEAYGPRYEQKLRERTQELGMNENEMTQMAMRSPKAFLALVNPQPSTNNLFSTPTSSLNSESLRRTSSSNEKNWAYYENLRKTNPKLYFEPRTHNEMMAQLRKLGIDEFYKQG